MFARLVFLRWGRAEGVRTTCRVRGVRVCRGKCNGATPPWAFHKRKRAPPEPGFYWEPRCVTEADAHARGRLQSMRSLSRRISGKRANVREGACLCSRHANPRPARGWARRPDHTQSIRRGHRAKIHARRRKRPFQLRHARARCAKRFQCHFSSVTMDWLSKMQVANHCEGVICRDACAKSEKRSREKLLLWIFVQLQI